MMKTTALIAFAAMLSFASCRKCDENLVSGYIRDAGPVAADGCGWLIEVGSQTFHPTNLDTKYEVDGLKVKLRYSSVSGQFSCGLAPNHYDQIQIDYIRKK
ncbi:MAG: hypothetical protein KDD36_10685 [Flavobacteriales bacterium]|nr:hypothetical protein [Flavobacteriales bacterium]